MAGPDFQENSRPNDQGSAFGGGPDGAAPPIDSVVPSRPSEQNLPIKIGDGHIDVPADDEPEKKTRRLTPEAAWRQGAIITAAEGLIDEHPEDGLDAKTLATELTRRDLHVDDRQVMTALRVAMDGKAPMGEKLVYNPATQRDHTRFFPAPIESGELSEPTAPSDVVSSEGTSLLTERAALLRGQVIREAQDLIGDTPDTGLDITRIAEALAKKDITVSVHTVRSAMREAIAGGAAIGEETVFDPVHHRSQNRFYSTAEAASSEPPSSLVIVDPEGTDLFYRPADVSASALPLEVAEEHAHIVAETLDLIRGGSTPDEGLDVPSIQAHLITKGITATPDHIRNVLREARRAGLPIATGYAAERSYRYFQAPEAEGSTQSDAGDDTETGHPGRSTSTLPIDDHGVHKRVDPDELDPPADEPANQTVLSELDPEVGVDITLTNLDPDQDPLDSDSWRSAIEEQIPEFRGDTANSGVLMAAMNRGRDHIVNLLAGTDVAIPPISILHETDDVRLGPLTAHVDNTEGEDDMILVSSLGLEAHSQVPVDELRSFPTGMEGAVLFVGTTKDLWMIAGFQEAHHAAFRAINPDLRTPTQAPGISSAAYHGGDEEEWHALTGQVVFAEELGMPAMTQEALHATREQARDYRERHGLPTDYVDSVKAFAEQHRQRVVASDPDDPTSSL